MDIHHKVVGVLHIVFGAISLLVVAMATLFFGVLSGFIHDSPFPVSMLASVGAAVAAVFASMALAEVIAGAMLLAGRRGAKPWLMAFGALQLLNIPFGTALGVYTLWALTSQAPPVVIVSTPTSLSR